MSIAVRPGIWLRVSLGRRPRVAEARIVFRLRDGERDDELTVASAVTARRTVRPSSSASIGSNDAGAFTTCTSGSIL